MNRQPTTDQPPTLASPEAEIARLKAENARLKAENDRMKKWVHDSREAALDAQWQTDLVTARLLAGKWA
jgi:transposase-like protein